MATGCFVGRCGRISGCRAAFVRRRQQTLAPRAAAGRCAVGQRVASGRRALTCCCRWRPCTCGSRCGFLPGGRFAGRPPFSEDHTDLWPLAFRVGLPAIVLAFVVAAVLGIGALLLTFSVALLTVLGWTAAHAGRHPGGALQPGRHRPAVAARSAGDACRVAIAWTPQLVLAGLWVVHHWGETRVLADDGDLVGMILLAVARLRSASSWW